MRISKHHISNLDLYLGDIGAGSTFRVVAAFPDPPDALVERVGLAAPLRDGDTVLPRAVGPISRFNARGRWDVRRDLPKEPRYIRTVTWRWTQWAGRDQTEHEDFRDIYRDCYPRDQVLPPAVELTVTTIEGVRHLSTPELTKSPDRAEHNKQRINLLLELCGSCELLTKDRRSLPLPSIRRANWRLLPSGEYPWTKIEAHIDAAVGKRSDDAKRVIWDRQQTIKEFGPDEIFVGEAGFDDYLAYVFRSRGIVVLESVRKDNAIYVFGLDWQRVSQLTKADIIRGGLHLTRIIHSTGWKTELARLMSERRAA